jgi:hypothetical protein
MAKKFKLIKDWPVRKGIIVKAGAEIVLQPPYAAQMLAAGVVEDPKNKLETKTDN